PYPHRDLGLAVRADRPRRLPLRGRLQAGQQRESEPHRDARRPVRDRIAARSKRGYRLPSAPPRRALGPEVDALVCLTNDQGHIVDELFVCGDNHVHSEGQAMARAGEGTLPLYPEARPCARPTTHRVIEVFSSIQRHEVRVGEGEPQVMVTKLTKTQRSIIRLLGLDPRTYGLA